MYDILSHDDLYNIHLATMEVLERVGVLIENEETLGLLEKAGANVDKKAKKVKIPEYLMKDGLKKVPSSFVLYSRKGEKVRIGGDKTIFSSGAGASWILDLETREPRPVTKRDCEHYAIVTDACEEFSLCMSPIIQDVTPALADVHSAEAMMCNTYKTPWVCPSDGTQARYIIEMAAIASGGMNELQKRPTIMGLASPNSPLRLAPNDIAVACNFIKNKLPISFIDCPNSGATTPVSTAGTLVVMTAECLSFVLIAELMAPGNPVVAGPSPVITDMRTATPAVGAPEVALVNAAAAQIMRYYGVPSFGNITSSDSMGIDVQTGYEIAWTSELPLLAGIDVVVGIGLIGNCNGCSLEKLVIDNEVLGGLRRILKGIDVSETSLAVDVIEAVGPGGHYLGQKHTRENLLKERWFPKISNRLGLQEWKKEKLDLWKRANKQVREILRTHCPEPLDKETKQKIRKLVQDAERNIAK